MKVQCLSIPNPVSYFVAYGFKDVESRPWETDYRGTIYIHSSGRRAIIGMPDVGAYPMPVINEFNSIIDKAAEIERRAKFIAIPEHGIRVELKDDKMHSDAVHAEYALLTDVYKMHDKDPKRPFFRVNAIIGKVDLVDIRRESNSKWAGSAPYHWILKNPVVFPEPILHVKGKNGLWSYDLGTEIRG